MLDPAPLIRADFPIPIFFFLFAAIVIVAIIFGAISAAKRRKALQEFAAARGLAFWSNGSCKAIYEMFKPFKEGHNRSVSNVLFGQYHNIEWELFDYSYKTGSGKNETSHSVGAVFAKVPLAFSPLQMRPEGFFDKVAGLMGFEDINFESEAFNRAYHVACKDRKLAYDLIHPRMIEYLLALPKYDWQLAGPYIVIRKTGHYSIEELSAVMSAIEGFLAQVPNYVRQDIGLTSRNTA